MSKKEKKIKSLKKELKELRAQVRKLKLAAGTKKRRKAAKAPGEQVKPQTPALAKSEKSPEAFRDTKDGATRAIGRP